MKRKFTFLIAAAMMLLTMMATTGEMWGQTTWEKATSIQVGDVVVLVTENLNNSTTKMELTSFSSINTVYGIGTAYTSLPAGTYTFDVVAGNSDGTFAFKHESSYLYWTSGNSLNVNSTLSDNTSWTVSIDESNSKATIKNAADNNRQIWWNVSSPRFACYTGKTEGNSYYITTLYKQVASGGGDTPSITANDVNIAYDATEGEIEYTINNGVTGGELTAEVTAGDWLDNLQVGETVTFNCDPNEAAAARTATVTLTYTYTAKEFVTKNVTVTQAGNPNGPGSEANPYTVTQAREAIDAGTGITNVYATGIISQVDSYNSNYSSITYWISSDGTTTSDQLEVYSGKGLNNSNFSSIDDVEVGATVVVYGTLKKYNDIYEFDKNNYLTSYTAPTHDVEAPTFDPVGGTYAQAQTVTMSCTTDGAAIHYTTDGTEPDGNSTQYTEPISVTTTTTFKAKAIKGDDASTLVTATYHICSADAPYTVAQALEFIEYPTSTIWVHGIVSTAPTAAPNNGQLTYYISDDGTTTAELQVYKGKGLDNAAFTAQDDIQVGDIVTVTGIVKIYNSAKEFDAGNYLTSFERPVEPAIVVEPATVNATAAETEGTLTVTYTAIETDLGASIYWYTDNTGNTTTDAPEWIIADINDQTLNVDYVIEANTGAARTAYMKVYGIDNNGDDVYSNLVTINQAEYVAPTPSIAVDPTLVEAPAAGADGTITVTLTAIDNNEIEVQWFESDGTTAATYDWIEADVDPNNDIAYVIDENTGDARSAYFKVYGLDADANDIYSELITINQAAPVLPTQVWDLSTNSYSTASNSQVTWTSDYATMTLDKNTSSTNANNYLGGGNNNHTRFYKDQILTITPNTGYIISSIVINSTGNSYVAGFTGNDWTNATAQAEGTVITVTPTNGNEAASVTISAACRSNAVTVYYTENNTPSITLEQYTYNLNANGGDAVLDVTYNNMPNDPQAEVIFYEANGETPLGENPTWITATINNAGNVNGHIDANTGDARSAYFKVKGIDANDNEVYSDLVTINQAAYVLSIEFETASIDLGAGGESDRKLSFEYYGLGNDPEFSVNCYASDGTTPATYDWLTTEITDGNKVSITVTANTGAARTAYFKVYGENGNVNTESNLVTVNQTEAAQTATYTLITDINDLTPGYHYLIASGTSGDVKVMGAQTSNNRGITAAAVSESSITLTTGNYYDFVISGDATNNWTIYDESNVSTGYLYAASSGSNYLRTRAGNNDGNSQWSIEIANTGVATIVAQGNYTRNTMQYNSSSSIFACYDSASQSAVYLYKKTTDTPVYYSPTEVTVNDPNTDTNPITVQNNEILELTGTISATDPANLIIEDGGQLVFNNDNVQATMKKSTAHAGAKTVGDWYTIASPLAANIATNTVSHLTTDNSGYDLYRYDEASSMWENIKAHGDFTQLEVGRGYLYWNADGVDIEFAGKLRNDSVTYDLTADGTGTYKGMNLIGNPFSQDITVNNITGATLTGGYVLSQAGAWSAEITEFKPCQGFLVQVDAAKTITISKSDAKSRANRNYIAFTVANSQYKDLTYAMFEEGLGLNKINHRNASIPMLYIAQNDENYAIATMSEETQSFNLNFKAMTTGQYTLSFKAEGNYDYLHVIDRLTGEDIDMLLDGEYSFIASPSDNDARFIVKLGYNANSNTENDIFAYQNGNDIIVNGEGELQVFDVTGRMVMNQHMNGAQTVNVPSQGVFIFKLNENVQKIVVR